jgi:hypothetical protein
MTGPCTPVIDSAQKTPVSQALCFPRDSKGKKWMERRGLLRRGKAVMRVFIICSAIPHHRRDAT